MAPEIFESNYKGEPVDVFAMGIVLFSMLTGRSMFQIDKNSTGPNPIRNAEYR